MAQFDGDLRGAITLSATVTQLDGGYSVQTFCPSLPCAMRVVSDILAVNPESFCPPASVAADPAPTATIEFEADPVLQAMIERSDEEAPLEGLTAGKAYMAEFGPNPVSQRDEE